VEDEIIKTLFFGTDNNNADIHTKKTSEDIFKRHVDKHLVDVRQIN
jgi:hypothetical protein